MFAGREPSEGHEPDSVDLGEGWYVSLYQAVTLVQSRCGFLASAASSAARSSHSSPHASANGSVPSYGWCITTSPHQRNRASVEAMRSGVEALSEDFVKGFGGLVGQPTAGPVHAGGSAVQPCPLRVPSSRDEAGSRGATFLPARVRTGQCWYTAKHFG